MPKTIAFYISSMRRGGAERVLANLAEYFTQKGYRIVLVTTRRAETEYDLPAQVVRRISEPTDAELKKGRIGNFLTRFQKLRGIWKEEKPDIILSFIGKNNMMALLTSRGLHIPVAVSVRGEPKEEYYNSWMRIMAQLLFRYAAGIILQTRQCFSFFPARVRKKAVILKNPVNTAFFRERFEGEREKTIIAVGQIDANKNHELLLRAFALLSEDFPDYRLVIYGDGEKRLELTELAASMNLADRVLFPGNVDNVVDAIYKTRVFVLSSDTEGMPNTLIEAMLLGLTVISTDCPCGGPADLIDHGVNGLLTPVGDVDKMKENLQFVLNDLQHADEMGRNAAKTGIFYSPVQIYGEWEKYMISLMKSGE